jgi:GTP-binding protein
MAVRAIERADVALVLVDAGEGLTDQDARLLALARERGCAVALLVNKWDLMEARDEGDRKRLADEIARRLRATPDVPVLRISARTGKGLGAILPRVDALAVASQVRLSTSELNRWLRDAVGRHEPAMAQRGPRRRPVKFFYATQTGIRPPTFLLFCTDPAVVQPSYLRFLENRLRERFDLTGTPVRLRLRKRSASRERGSAR